MNRPRAVFYRFSLVSVLLLLLLPLVACGGGPDQGEQVQEGETPAPPVPGQAQGGGRRGAKGHVTLTGELSFDGDVPVSCGVSSDSKELEVIFNPNEGEASQVQVQIASFNGAGNYPATFTIREGGTARRWNGNAQVEVQSRGMGKKNAKRTALSGTLNGTYKGEGQGTIAGNFRRCVIRDEA